MRCSNCGIDNPAGSRFCNQCGTPLSKVCPKCAVENAHNAKFCSQCGVSLDPLPNRDTEAESRKHALTGERRHLTVLFCDLVGSSEIAARLDPEEWREVLAGYHRAAADAITRFGGHVANFLGDGVMAYFGWPEAHENDAERAARAGLAILDEVARFNQQSTHPKVSVRVGIDSGSVVVGAGAGKEADVFGEAPNIAARVQNAAAPDTLLLTASTHRLVSGLFVVVELGTQELKGIANPVLLYRVLRSTGVRGRVAAARGLTPFVGREEELQLLLSRWERAHEGKGQVVLVVGEPGIGKSRLVAEFHNRIRDTPHIWMESAGEQFFENTPFHAITEMLSQWLELQGGTSPDDRLDRLDRALASVGLKPEEVAPLVADLLQLPVDQRYPAFTFNPEQRRRGLLTALTGWVFGAAKLQLLVMVVEDLHWLDPSTLELEHLLAEQGVTVPLMLICTARPEFHAQWPMRSHHTQITLDRLSAPNVRAMVTLVAAHNVLAHESVDAVVERTGGVPLFVEELTRAVLESGAVKPSAREIPVTLHDSLMARLDRLGPGKEVIQIGAVIGAEFSYELLHAVYPIAEQDLQAALRSATDADLIYARGLPPDVIYQFKHALIRDAAYEALLKSRRKELHRKVALMIENKFPSLPETHPEILARHWTEAGETDLAISLWSKVGDASRSHCAFREAYAAYQNALVLLELLQQSRERDERQLSILSALTTVLQITHGYSASETIEVSNRARALSEKVGDLRNLVLQAMNRWAGFSSAGDSIAAKRIAEETFEIAFREGDSVNLAYAHMAMMTSEYRLGI
jgi:class 3 adenylate cyclase